jgi:ribose transport system ATP-binding protein
VSATETLSENLLDVRNVSKRFGSVVALRSATMSVRAGEVHALMGANGAGKSTLVKILTGVFAPDGGTIAVRGAERAFRSPKEARAAGIVSVYQDPALVPDLTILDNMRLAGVAIPDVRGWIEELGLGALAFSSFVRDLPYPVLRLIDLARALASEPTILMLDEITAALPTDLSESVYKVMRRWRERGRAVIFISHRMAEVAAHCDRATVLRDGVVVGVTETASGSGDEIVSLMLGRTVERARPALPAGATLPGATPGAAPALEVRDLRCGHRLDGVTFRLRAGEILGVAALEGQGQQELFDCIAGARRFDSGAITVNGRTLRLRHPADAVSAGVVMVPANRLQALLQQRSIRENVALPSYRRMAQWGLIAMRGERSRVESAVHRLQIDTRAESAVRQLSGGNQQKVVVARWVASGFKVLLCFDATRGIDIGTKHQIYRLVREFAAAGSAVLLFSSELPEIQLACDRAVVLFGGRIVDEMPASAADEATLLRAAHGLPARAEQPA